LNGDGRNLREVGVFEVKGRLKISGEEETKTTNRTTFCGEELDIHEI
jgi:hypothetical protein